MPGKVIFIGNANARRARLFPKTFLEVQGEFSAHAPVHVTHSLDELNLLARKIREENFDVVCLYGGDGTIMHGISALKKAYGSQPLPTLWLIAGGTMNLVADYLKLPPYSARYVTKVFRQIHTGDMSTLSLGTIDTGDHVGFVAGIGGFANFVRHYRDSGKASKAYGMGLLLRTAASVLVRGSWARTIFSPMTAEVNCADKIEQIPTLLNLGTSSIPTLGFGSRPFLTPATNEMSALIFKQSMQSVLHQLPALFLGKRIQHPHIGQFLCRDLRVKLASPQALMLDGEILSAAEEFHFRPGPILKIIRGPAT